MNAAAVRLEEDVVWWSDAGTVLHRDPNCPPFVRARVRAIRAFRRGDYARGARIRSFDFRASSTLDAIYPPDHLRPCELCGPRQHAGFEAPRNDVGEKADKAAVRTAQKPLGVMTYFVALACGPGGIVLDPFCGTGGTLAASRRLGLSAIGIDEDPGVLPLIQRRVSAAALPLLEALEVP